MPTQLSWRHPMHRCSVCSTQTAVLGAWTERRSAWCRRGWLAAAGGSRPPPAPSHPTHSLGEGVLRSTLGGVTRGLPSLPLSGLRTWSFFGDPCQRHPPPASHCMLPLSSSST